MQPAVEWVLDTLILLTVTALSGMRVRLMRILLTGAAGVWVSRVLLPEAKPVTILMLWPVTAAALMAAAGAGAGIVQAAQLTAGTMALGGLTTVWTNAMGSSKAGLVCGTAAYAGSAYGIIRTVRKRTGREICGVRITLQGVEAEFAAIADSGNTLRDYLSQRAVVVLPAEAADAVWTAQQIGSRLISAQTAGGKQLMRITVPDDMRIILKNGERTNVTAAVALADAMSGEMPALVPPMMTGNDETR